MVERRKHKRYPMPRGTFVILRNELDRLRNHSKMNIGEIAMVLYKSEPELIGQVNDLSINGVSFSNQTTQLPATDHIELDLLMAEQGIYVHNIPFVTVPTGSNDKGKSKKHPFTRSDALGFKNLDAEHKGCLQELLTHCVG